MSKLCRTRFTFVRIAVLLGCLTTSSDALAAKKKPAKTKITSASTAKGFAAAPLTYANIVSDFRTRLPENADNLPCPCGSVDDTDISQRLLYKDCCQPLHDGSRTCSRPLEVLRSRYSAFSYRLIAPVIATTHPTCRDYQDDKIAWARSLNRDGMFDSFDFVALEHSDEHVEGDTGSIEFKVRLRAKDRGDDSLLSGKESAIVEKSIFLRNEQGVWLYASGEVRTAATGDSVLN